MLASIANRLMNPVLDRKRPRQSSAPIPVPAETPALQDADLAAVYYGQRVGGDFYDFLRVSPTRVVFGLMDLAGSAAQNRGILSTTQGAFRKLAAELLAADNVNEAEAMIQIALRLNRMILSQVKGVRPCPAFAGSYNENLGIVCYFNAGHTPGLVRDHTGLIELPATGLPLGLFSHTAWDAPMVALQPGAALLLASRGLIEGKSRSKAEEFGLDRLKDSFRHSTAESAKELCVSAIDCIKQFMGTAPTHNDVTALALFRKPSAPALTLGTA